MLFKKVRVGDLFYMAVDAAIRISVGALTPHVAF